MCNEHHFHHCHRLTHTGHPHPRFWCMMPYMSIDEEIKMLERAKEILENRLKQVNERLERLRAGKQTS